MTKATEGRLIPVNILESVEQQAVRMAFFFLFFRGIILAVGPFLRTMMRAFDIRGAKDDYIDLLFVFNSLSWLRA